MSRYTRLLRLAKGTTPERLDRTERIVYPALSRGLRSGRILESQKEAVLKALSAGAGVGLKAIKMSYQKIANADPDRPKDPEQVGIYSVRDGAVAYERTTHDGPVTTPLCNFNARIIEERERDDGVERSLVLIVRGTLATGQPLPDAEVSAAQFAGLSWTVPAWGTRAVVNAGQGAKDHLRAAVQMLSGNVPRRTTYTHLGWREVDGQMVYLHAGGVISAPPAPEAPLSIQVEPPGGLELFTLPELPTGDALERAIRLSLETLDLAPDPVSVPLLGATYRAVLGGVDFGLHLAGQTGAGKSELAAIFQAHFGPGLNARTLPGSWSSTANALEGLAFGGKDVLVTVDDFAPEGSSHDVQRYHATAARLFRAQGNNAARGRMRADGSLRPNKPPRGMILSTGEDVPKGHSIKARTLILELEPGALNWSRLTTAQRLAAEGVYAAAMSGFIAWLAEDYKERTAAFRADHARYRAELQNTGHKRTVDAGAQLLATYRSLLSFAREVGALTEAEHVILWHRVEAGVKAALEPQAALQAQSDPVARFSELLTGLFVSGRAHVADAKTGEYPGDGWGWHTQEVMMLNGPETRYMAKGPRIGWLDGSDLYLEPSATYAELQRFARDQGESVPVTERTLWKRLAERGVIVSREEPHATVKRTFAGTGRLRVLHLTSTLYTTGASGANGAEHVQDDTNPRPTLEAAKAGVGQVGQQEAAQEPRPNNAPVASGAAGKSGARESASGTSQTPLAPVAPLDMGVEAGAVIQELRRRYEAEELRGVAAPIPGGKTDDLQRALEYYFTKTRLTDTERHDLLGIARAVVAEPEAHEAAA